MYVDTSKIKTYTRHLLRESYRENGKVRHRTVANLSSCSEDEVAAIRLALRHKKELSELISGLSPAKTKDSGVAGKRKAAANVMESMEVRQGLSIGAVWVVHEISRQLGISDALGSGREGKLALWQVIARVIDQGSRLSAVRLAGYHGACDLLGLGRFDEDSLYKNLDWLSENQTRIEDRLYRNLSRKSGLYLYDVTSSYLEGCDNEYSAFGYNRDGKKGKRQIVIGLLCDGDGVPLSIEVFPGNTQDVKTFYSQVRKVSERFNNSDVTLVGDRGMIKSAGIKEVKDAGFHYITAITRPQIEKMLATGVFQMGLFEDRVSEITDQDGTRYVLRRNPVRAREIAKSRDEKIKSLEKEVLEQNAYLKEHPRAKVDTAAQKVIKKIERLRLDYISVSIETQDIASLRLVINEEAGLEASKLDGCYVIKTDLTNESASKEEIHARYKDLAHVEWAFRTSKTVELEVRPVHVRLASRTRGHVFVVMLAYRVVKELSERWSNMDVTVEEGIKELSTLCANEVEVKGLGKCNQIPKPRESVMRLLDAANVKLPEALPCRGIKVTTKKKLTERRKTL